MAGDRRAVAAAVLRVPVARRRVRHLRLQGGAAGVRHPAGVHRARLAGPCAWHPDRHRPRHEPHQRPAPVVPVQPHRARRPVRGLLRLVRHGRPLQRGPHHLHRHRGVELDLRPGPAAVLLAPVLLAPAGPQLREPAGPSRDVRRRPVLDGPRYRRVPARCDPLPLRGGGDQLREPRPDARVPRRAARHGGRRVPRPGPAGRGQPAAGRGRRLLRDERGAGVPDVLPLPGDAAPLLRAARGAGGADRRRLRRHPVHPDRGSVGHLSAQPRRADPRDGLARGAVGDVRLVRAGLPDARERRHPPAARSAAGQLAAGDRADPLAAAVAAGDALSLLRRRDRDGRQHLAERPRRGAHADAVDPRPQLGLLGGRPRKALPPSDFQPRLPLQHGQRRGPDGHVVVPPALAPRDVAGPEPASGVRARRLPRVPDRERGHPVLRAAPRG